MSGFKILVIVGKVTRDVASLMAKELRSPKLVVKQIEKYS